MASSGQMSAISIPMRPLDKGMILNKPSQLLPDGAFTRLRNFLPSTLGPKRRPGFTQYASGDTAEYPMVDYVTLWMTNGAQISLLMTEKFLYRVNPLSGFSRVDWFYAGPGTGLHNGYVIEDTSAHFLANDITLGDVVEMGTYSGIIVEILSDTRLRMDPCNIPEGYSGAYNVQRSFGPGICKLPDWTIFNSELIIADGKRPLTKYNPVTNQFEYWTTDPAKKLPGGIDFIPGCVTSFGDRIWCGYTVDATDGTQRQRIRWSALADETDFHITTNYLDLPYVNGAVRRLIPLGNTLIAYFDDALYMGVPTNMPLMPLRFDAIETGGIGLVGPKAVTAFTGGHFYIGQDDMYFLTRDGAQRIGSPITKESIKLSQTPERCYVAMDPWNTCVVFGFTKTHDFMESLWMFDYTSKGWSYTDIQTYMIANPVVNTSIAWDDLTGTWDTLGNTFPGWDSIKLDDPRKFLFIESASILWKGTEAGNSDFNVNAISCTLSTKDHDFGEPDTLKTFVRFGIKIEVETVLEETLQFATEVSTNRGRSWKYVGVLAIPINKDEGYVNFRSTGSTVQFRLTSTSPVESYTITEYVIKTRLHGSERDTSTQL